MPKNRNNRRAAAAAAAPDKGFPPYKPIATEFLGQQKLSDEFRRDLQDAAYWRNNLAAASIHHNYLFIAQSSRISVYIPTYPYQTLPETPHAVLTSEQIVPSDGFIDQRHPHAINSLTIGELGTEEVLVSAHDDGDVCVWYTRDLSRMALRYNVGMSAWGVALHKERRLLAVSANTKKITVFELAGGREEQAVRDERQRRGEESDEDGEEGTGAARKEGGTPFGRKTKHTTRPNGKERRDNGDADFRWKPTASRKGKKRRKDKSVAKDKAIKVLVGHAENIPSISFLNDASGRWLVGTSIDGMVILWDVHTQRMVERCRLGFTNRGWSVVFLTPQSFKPMNTMYEALDKSSTQMPRRSRGQFSPHHELADELPPRAYVSGVRSFPTDYYSPPAATQVRSNEARAWDISPVSAPDYMAHHDLYNSEGEGEYQFQVGEIAYYLPPADETSEDEDEDEEDEGPDADYYTYAPTLALNAPLSPPPIPTVPDPPVDDPGDGDDGDAESESSSSEDTGSPYHQDASMDTGLFGGEVSWGSISESLDSQEEAGDGEEEEEETTVSETEGSDDDSWDSAAGSEQDSDDSVAATGVHHLRPRKHQSHHHSSVSPTALSGTSSSGSSSEPEPEPAQPPLSFIFSTTEHNAYLLPTTFLSPTVVCKSFLSQPLSAMHQFLLQIDRLNMVIPIPELSLMVVASQIGRVGIFKLTRCGDNFGMRLDTILPREHGMEHRVEGEVDLNARPAAALLGIAASPVQGKEMGRRRDTGEQKELQGGRWRGVAGRRRWRLMMVFMDGSILSYELGRERGEEGPGGLGKLLGIGGFMMV